MNDPAPPPPPAAPAPPPAPAPDVPPPQKSRRWFNILAAVVLAGFAVFVAAVTVLAVLLPSFRGR